jgi:TPR repeat protein
MNFRNLRHGKATSTNPNPAAPPSAASHLGGTNPEIKVELQPKPQTKNQIATASPDVTNPVRTPAMQGAAQAAAAPTSTGAAKSGTERAVPQPHAALGNDAVAARNALPGEDEMARAKSASDTAAEAAWLWKATAKGNPDAPVQLADLYVKGDGVPRSCEQAMVLLKTAAEKPNVRARNRLASMYTSGTCVSRNRVQAYRWLGAVLAADPNSQSAQQNRAQLWQNMTPEERGEAAQYR